MGSWYRLSLGDPLLADSACREIAEAAKAEGVPVFMRHESEGQVHCELVLYFPVETRTLARAYRAVPCPAPEYGLSPLI